MNLRKSVLSLVIASMALGSLPAATAGWFPGLQADLAGIYQAGRAAITQGARQLESLATVLARKLQHSRAAQAAAIAVGAGLATYVTYRLIKAYQAPYSPLTKLQQDSLAASEQRCQAWLKEHNIPRVQSLWQASLLAKLNDRLNAQRVTQSYETFLASEPDLITYFDQAGQQLTDAQVIKQWSQQTMTLQRQVITLLTKHKVDLSKIKLRLTMQWYTQQPIVQLYASRTKPGQYVLQLNLRYWYTLQSIENFAAVTTGAAATSLLELAQSQLVERPNYMDQCAAGWYGPCHFETQLLRCVAQIKYQDDLQLDLALLELQEPMVALLVAEPKAAQTKVLALIRRAESIASEYAKLCAERADLYAMWHHSKLSALAVYEQLQDFSFKQETAQYDFFRPAGYQFYNYRQTERWRELQRQLLAIRDGVA